MAVGNDFSAVQAGELSERAQRQQAARDAENRLAQVMQYQQQAGMQNRQFQYQTQVQNPQQMALEREKLDTEKVLAERRAKAEEDRNTISQGYLDVYKRQAPTEAPDSPAKIKDHEFAFNSAAHDAENGLFDSPEHAQQLYPNLTPAEANLMAQRSQSIRPQHEEAFHSAENARSLLNAYDHAITLAPKEMTAPPSPSWYDSAATKAQKAQVAQAFKVRKHLDDMGIIPALRKSPLVNYNTEQDGWQSAIPQPRWYKPAGSGGTGGGGAPAPDTSGTNQYQPGQLNPLPPPAAGRGRDLSYVPPMQPPGAPAGDTNGVMPGGQGRHPAPVYERAQQLVTGAGLDPRSAMQRSLAEWQQATQSNSLP